MLNFSINRLALQNALKIVKQSIGSKVIIPVLTKVKIVVDAEGLTLTGSNGQISIEHFIPVSNEDAGMVISSPGAILIEANFFENLVASAPEVTVDLQEIEQHQLQLTSGKFEITLKGLDADQYPRIQEIASDTPLKINVGVLKTIFAETAFAASQQESRPILTGVHLSLTDNKNLKAVATDSHRLSQRKMVLDHAAENFNLVIPNKSIAAFRSVFTNDEAELEVFMNENQLLFRTETISFYTRLIEGTYPETDRLIPAESDYTLTVDFKNNDLKRTMDRAKLLTSSTQNGTVKLQFTEDEKVMITVNSAEVGNSVEELDAVAIAGSPLSISFNPLFMIDALKVIDAETVRVRFISSVRPFTLEPVDQTSELIQLITPVRTN